MIGYFDAVVSNSDIAISTITDAQGTAIGTQYGGYVDSAREKYVQTHGYIASYAGEAVGDDWISSTGELTMGAQVVYRLDAPVEYGIAELPTVCTGDGSTSACTDSGNIEIAGAVDPRWESEQQAGEIDQLRAAIVALGGTI